MRHANATDLERIGWLLEQLRAEGGLKERTPGTFQRRSRAFLHFHEHEGSVLADVRLATAPGSEFERFPVDTKRQQRELLKRIVDAL